MCGTINFSDHYPAGSKRQKIWDAVFAGNAEVLEQIMDNELRFNPCDKRWLHVMKAACSNGSIEIVELLTRKGVELPAHDGEDENLLFSAVKSGNLELVKYLIESGANINSRDNKGFSLLDYATANANIDIIHYLLSKGINAEITSANQAILENILIKKISSIFKQPDLI